MTCIVGVKHEGSVYIGGDSAGVNTGNLAISARKDSKVFVNGSCVMGYTTSFRMGQLLRYAFKVPKFYHGTDVFEYMVTTFVDEIRKVLKEGGFASKDKETEEGGTFLVGYAGRLFAIESDYQVAEEQDDFASVGCGYMIARGSLNETGHLPPMERITRALNTAEKFSAGVRGPINIVAGGKA